MINLNSIKNKKILLLSSPSVFIDDVQNGYNTDIEPTGLLKILSFLKKNNQIYLLDTNKDRTKKFFYKDMYAGIGNSASLKSFIYIDLSYLKSELIKFKNLDYVWVSNAFFYNEDVLINILKILKKVHPHTKLYLGGAGLIQNEIFAKKFKDVTIVYGKLTHVDNSIPDYSDYDTKLITPVVSISDGCVNNCNFCSNSGNFKLNNISEVMIILKNLSSKYGFRNFHNWDPNILVFKKHFIKFLKTLIQGGSKYQFRFEMGLQPNLLDDSIMKLMKQARVISFTIPFETSDPRIYLRLNKPYSIISSIKALYLAKKYEFDLSTTHCTNIIGFPDDDIKHVFRIYLAIKFLGGVSTPFPITLIPETKTYETYKEIVSNKTLSQLNGHLWPLVKDSEVRYKQNLLFFLKNQYPSINRIYFRNLPMKYKKIYKDEVKKTKTFIRLCLENEDNYENLIKINNYLNTLRF